MEEVLQCDFTSSVISTLPIHGTSPLPGISARSSRNLVTCVAFPKKSQQIVSGNDFAEVYRGVIYLNGGRLVGESDISTECGKLVHTQML
jgi:hypothetical protein